MPRQTGIIINTLHLKLIAVVSMLIDHIAYVVIPVSTSYWIMRSIGRLAAPLFWYCFVEGYKRTSNKHKYKLRLAISAIIMSFGNYLINSLININSSIYMSAFIPNMFLTFFLMAIIIDLINKISEKSDWPINILYFVIMILAVSVVAFCAEYSWFAILSILCLYFVKNKPAKYILFVVGNLLLCIATQDTVQMFMVFAIFPMLVCSDQKPKQNLKWFFYLFYPLHFWTLCLIKWAIQYFC